MKWPFARHAHSSPAAGESTGAVAAPEPARADIVAPSRRDWASLPPLEVARPINLTAPTRTFTEGLASRQVLVRAPRLEMVRRIDAPSGSLRGVLAPSVGGHDDAGLPDLQEASPLPAVEHRHLGAAGGDQPMTNGLSPIEQLLTIGESVTHEPSPAPHLESSPPIAQPDAPDVAVPPGGRRAGL